MKNESLFIPAYLQSLGYAEFPEFRELSNRAITMTAEAIHYDSTWWPWHGILEYACCVEYARQMLKNLPSGRALGSVDVVPARYHSASLVFFAQAALDNIAAWSSQRLNLSVKGSDCAFHKTKFNQALTVLVPNVAATINSHAPFVAKVGSYRQEWIHRLTGGASIYSNKSPSEPDAEFQIMVPINPAISHYSHNGETYVRAVARRRTNNDGIWLYPVAEFADEFADGLKAFLVSFLSAAIAEPRFEST